MLSTFADQIRFGAQSCNNVLEAVINPYSPPTSAAPGSHSKPQMRVWFQTVPMVLIGLLGATAALMALIAFALALVALLRNPSMSILDFVPTVGMYVGVGACWISSSYLIRTGRLRSAGAALLLGAVVGVAYYLGGL